jgi:hypothetical protein
VDLEAVEAELKHQRQDLAWQRDAHPLNDDDDTCTGAPSGLCFPYAAYNMAAIVYRREDISDTLLVVTNDHF